MRIKTLVSFLLLGGAIIGAAFFAEFIGLDNDPGWGKGRVAILVVGLLTMVWGVFSFVFADNILSTLRTLRSKSMQNARDLQEWARRYWYIFPAVVLVILVYIWFASSGSWTNWDPATRYYADLANAFEHGQLHLLTRPSSELLNLSNPYDPELRKGISFPIDYALYNGKYYLYWGPVPALLLVLLNPFVSGKIGDLVLAFGFLSGIFLLQVLFLLTIWNHFFRHLPKWILVLSILVSGLSGPWTYMLVNEPNGRIYEAAILGAQFFLLGGLLITTRALVKSDLSYVSLAFAGLLWGLSIGTRLVIAVPIGIACLLIAYQAWRLNRPSIQKFLLKLLALGLPLGFCLLCIGWYNWARFGSVADTGFAYSLAHQDMLKYRNDLFSPLYIIQNIYNYVLNAPTYLDQFPFLQAQGRTENILPFSYSLPDVYNAQPITGLLLIAPFALFLMTLFFQRRSPGDPISQRMNSINGLLLGTFTSAFVFLLIFFWAALRYMGDFMPELILAGIIGFWHGYQLLDLKPAAQKIYSVTAVVLTCIGIAISILISLSANQYV